MNVSLHINPQNPKEYLFELHHGWGPYLVGFLPGLFFFLFGLSVLLKKEDKNRKVQLNEK